MDFAPKLIETPTELTSAQLLSQLPDTYLNNPCASNYVALGVVYCLMGLGTPEDPDYVDRVLAGVFTALNDKAVELGLSAFDPPTSLSSVVTSRTAALIDAYLLHQADTTMDLAHVKVLVQAIFGHDEAHVGAAFMHHVNDAIAALIELGYPFPPPTTQTGRPPVTEGDIKPEKRLNYDAILSKALRAIGIPDAYIQDGLDYIIEKRLLPTSAYIRGANVERGDLGSYFVGAAPSMVSDYRKHWVAHNKREINPVLPSDRGEGQTLLDVLPAAEPSPSEVDASEVQNFLQDFRNYLESFGGSYYSNPESLVQIFDMLRQGISQKQILDRMNLKYRPYQECFSAIRSIGADFAENPEYLKYTSLIERLLDL